MRLLSTVAIAVVAFGCGSSSSSPAEVAAQDAGASHGGSGGGGGSGGSSGHGGAAGSGGSGGAVAVCVGGDTVACDCGTTTPKGVRTCGADGQWGHCSCPLHLWSCSDTPGDTIYHSCTCYVTWIQPGSPEPLVCAAAPCCGRHQIGELYACDCSTRDVTACGYWLTATQSTQVPACPPGP